MSIEIKNGKLTVSASYGLTQNLGDYSSQKATAGLTIEMDAEGADSVVLDAGQKLYDTLVSAVKMGVMANLGIEGTVDDEGVLQPVLTSAISARPVAAPQQAPAPRPNTYGGGGGGGGQRPQYTSKYDTSTLPVFVADLGDGNGTQQWYDLRPQKTNPNAADFRTVNVMGSGKRAQVWLKDKGGNVKATVAQALQAAGVNVLDDAEVF